MSSPFPDDKPKREAFVVECAIAAAKSRLVADAGSLDSSAAAVIRMFADAKAIPNVENDFDFTFETATTREPVELTEFAPLDLFGSYENVPDYFRIGPMGDLLFRSIMKKAEHYGPTSQRTIHLLTYATDFRLAPDDVMTDLLTVLAHRYEKFHSFASITSVFPQEPVQIATLDVLYPRTPRAVARLDESALRKLTVRKFDVGKHYCPVGGRWHSTHVVNLSVLRRGPKLSPT